MTVATAAPCIPIFRAKMKIGSRTMFTPAPSIILNIAVLAFPSERTRLFVLTAMPKKTLPRKITER